MKERPILFSAPMVRAILAERKTQTRRVAKLNLKGHLRLRGAYSTPIKDGVVMWTPVGGEHELPMPPEKLAEFSPYGGVGDRLWVREKWVELDPDHFFEPAKPRDFVIHDGKKNGVGYAADCVSEDSERCRKELRYDWRSPIYMPRWASRITLEITGVRVERVQDISEADAKAEGMYCIGCSPHKEWTEARFGFYELWNSIHSEKSWNRWERNPWVWVIEFKRIDEVVAQTSLDFDGFPM